MFLPDDMSPIAIIAIVIVVIIIILIIYKYMTSGSLLKEYILGFWECDENFCEDADIDKMFLYFASGSTDIADETAGYIIIQPDITSQDFTTKLKLISNSGMKLKYNAEIKFAEDDIMPENVNIDVDILKGCLKIYDDIKVYGLFYKNHNVSNYFVL